MEALDLMQKLHFYYSYLRIDSRRLVGLVTEAWTSNGSLGLNAEVTFLLLLFAD